MLFSTVIRCFENPVHTCPNDTKVLLQIDDTPCTIGQIYRAHQRVGVPRCRSSEEVPEVGAHRSLPKFLTAV